MRTAAVILQAFVLSALIVWFVLELRTIGLLVANLGQGNAHSTTAVELRLGVALDGRTFCCEEIRHHPKFSTVTALLTTIDLIAAIRALRFTIAVEVPIDAGFVLFALELIGPAGYILADWRHLVVTLRTILLAVTDPAFVDTGDSI